MKSAGFRGTLPNPYRERSVANLQPQPGAIHGHRRATEAEVSNGARRRAANVVAGITRAHD